MLADRGHNVTVITSDYKFDNSYANSLKNVEIISFKTLIRYGLFIVTPGMISWLESNISKYDVIHLHEFQSYQNSICYHYARKYHVPYIVQARGLAPHIMKCSNLKRLYNLVWGYRILKNASKCLALTSIEKKEYMDMGCLENRIAIMPNGIDLSQFKNTPQNGAFKKTYNLSLGDPLILFLGRIHEIKGIDILVKAFSKILIKNEYKNAKLAIVGPDDGYGLILRKLVKDLSIDKNVIFAGPLYGEKKWEAFVDADTYVLPSVYDAFPNTVLEAWACHVPVIMTNGCCLSEDAKEAAYVIKNNEDLLSDAIIEVMSNSKLRRTLISNSETLLKENYSLASVLDTLEWIYKKSYLGA